MFTKVIRSRAYHHRFHKIRSLSTTPLLMARNPSNGNFSMKYTFIATASLVTFACLKEQEMPSRMEEIASDDKEKDTFVDILENDWETFMIKSMDPNEEEEDDDDDDDDEEEEDKEEDKDDENYEDDNNVEDVDVEEDGTQGEDEEKNLDIENDIDHDREIDEVGQSLKADTSEAQNESQEGTEMDPYDNLPEEDEPTNCVICLINRQGPCRVHWRKFERCMKDNSKDENASEENDNDSSSPSSSSLGEKCDVYMLPWIRCIQEFRNKYTLISNSFFQKELIEDVESHISDDERVLLDNIDPASIVILNEDWYEAKAIAESASSETSETDASSMDKDDVLASGIARINLWDQKGDCPIEVAYVKDQDDKLLGYEQFFDFKKSIKSGEYKDGSLKKKVGSCNFHVSPETTKAIRIYALYRTGEEAIDDTPVDDTPQDQDPTTRKNDVKTLYYSTPIGIHTIPVQEKAEQSHSAHEEEDSSSTQHTKSTNREE
jgi:hypothetical protein